MIVRKERSTKMPTYNSYYVSDFGDDLLEVFKKHKPYTFYLRNLLAYEITPEIYDKYVKPVQHILIDDTRPVEVFRRFTGGKYGYQEDAVAFSKQADNILLNFSQGMGKTLTSFKIIKANNLTKTLVICGQSNLQEEWLKDAKKHNVTDEYNVRIVCEDTGYGNPKKIKWLKENSSEPGVYLINIEALRDVDLVEVLNSNNYDCIIVDEIQSAKGWKAQQTKGLHELVRREGQKRIALSGTPILNDPLEYFSLLKFLDVLKDTVRTTFEAYYGEWGFDFWGNRKCTGYRNLEDLRDLLKPVLCYVGKEELGLPKKNRKKMDLQWKDKDEFLRLQKVYKLPIKRLKQAGYNTKPQVRALMQVLSSTTLEKTEFINIISKMDKSLVFSLYTTVLEVHKGRLEAQGIRTLYYHGDLKMKERLQVLQDWFDNKADVLLLSEMTARFGLNLTEATNTIFLEPPPSLGILEQCEDRAHRIGQEKEVNSYLLCSSHLDDDALENIRQKQESIDKLKELLIN